MSQTVAPSVLVEGLTFDFGGPTILKDVNLSLPPGSRCLLVGANGAGKSTLLRLLAGKRLIKQGRVEILGQRAFYEALNGVTYLGTEWATNPVVRGDVVVSRLLKSMGSEKFPERSGELLENMDANPEWHMNAVSDGERRRVQIVMGLMEPWQCLLLDEVTVDLDVVVRTDLLRFLKKETEERNATIVYATHIFDGLGDWPTHVAHMRQGQIVRIQEVGKSFPELEEEIAKTDKTGMSPLMRVVEKWLRQDLILRRQSGKKYDQGHEEESGKRVVDNFGLTKKSPMQLYDYSH